MTNNMLSFELQRRIQSVVGYAVNSYLPVIGGYTPASRWIIETDKGRFFAKVATTPLTAVLLRREAHAYEVVNGRFMPEWIGWEDHETEPILIIEDLSAAYWPPPWDQELVDLVLSHIDELHQISALLPTFHEQHGERGNNWATISESPERLLALGIVTNSWLETALPTLIEAENSCTPEGQAVTHWDIRSDNLCKAADGVKFVDWAEACLSNPKLDLGFWLPSLAFEGGPKPEKIMPHEPEIAAWVSGFFAARAGLPEIPDAPHVRTVQRQQLGTALAWAKCALDLPNGDFEH